VSPSHITPSVRSRVSILQSHGAQGPGSFVLETGGEQLAPWFEDVSLHRYDDALVVTEAGPLIDYVLSRVAMPRRAPSTRPRPKPWPAGICIPGSCG